MFFMFFSKKYIFLKYAGIIYMSNALVYTLHILISHLNIAWLKQYYDIA